MPFIILLAAQGPQGLVQVLAPIDMLAELGRRRAHQGVELSAQLGAEGVEREVVDVVAEGVLQLVSDGGDSEDDICCRHGSGDGNPAVVGG